MRNLKSIIFLMLATIYLCSCNSNTNNTEIKLQTDSIKSLVNDTVSLQIPNSETEIDSDTAIKVIKSKTEVKPKVLIYNFYATNRCVSCVAIEEATKKTIETYFASELKNGTIKLYTLCVDDEVNSKIAEKYQAFGSALFVTRVYNGKETSTDLTGDGFKYAKNKQEKFIEILKNKLIEYLK